MHNFTRCGLLVAFTLLSGLVGAEPNPQASSELVTGYLVTPDENGESRIARMPSSEKLAEANRNRTQAEFLEAIDRIEAE